MNEDVVCLLRAARDSLAAAKLLMSRGFAGYAASRAYYSMLYCAQAFLERKGIAFSKHSAVIAAFGKELAKTGRVPVEYHRYLIEAQEVRLAGDYRVGTVIEQDQADRQIQRAEAFLKLAEEFFGSASGDCQVIPGETNDQH